MTLPWRWLGRVSHADGVGAQEATRDRLLAGDEAAACLLLCEHDPVITLGRHADPAHVVLDRAALDRRGVAVVQATRGGDVTYHGPGQVVGYPIMDLREWKRDVVAYVRAVEQVLINALAEFDIHAGREAGMTGIWVGGRKIAAIGVHISRWVTSHGFALNLDTDLSYFQYIVPCGLTKPVTSMRAEGAACGRPEVVDAIARQFGRVFDRELVSVELFEESVR